ncbi:hypothetical protein [Nocardia wallacei]|uniref:hypothetical protein n=1 Tax=Nocardia wallacei TaxID=480035 RepID=UPI002453D35F|nr:hypothetical protein [Nocardia wallacei]
MSAVLPLAYGYLRVDLLDDELIACEERLTAVAQDLGFELAAVFCEQPPQRASIPPAYLELLRECCRTQAHTVITLPGHLSGMAVPRMCLLEVLAVRAAAQVCEVDLETGL